MNWRDHSRLTGKHALLGASNYYWLNYDADRLTNAVLNYQARERGTRLHAFAAECIDLKQKLPKNKKTLNTYVNDAHWFPHGYRAGAVLQRQLLWNCGCHFVQRWVPSHSRLKKPELFLHTWSSSLFMPLCSAWSTDTTRKIFRWSSVSTRTMKFGSRIPLKRKSAPSSLKSKSLTQSSLIFC